MNDPVEILLVDDNPSDEELTLHALSRNGLAKSVKVVHDGAEALEYIFCTGAYAGRDPQNPRLILLDLHLPKVDGMEVLRRAKADAHTQAIPIVVFSASWEERDVQRARELGAHSYMQKPVDSKQFADAVRTALSIVALKILILEDRQEDAELMVHELRRSGFDPQWVRVETEPDFLAHLDPAPDVILADYSMPEMDTSRALQLLQESGLSIPFIVVSGTIGEDVAVALIRQGASDYLLKDRLGRLGPAVKNALAESKLRQEKSQTVKELQASEARFHTFMRHSPALSFIKDEFSNILYVNNASGYGKEVAAQLRAGDAAVFETGLPSRTVEEVTAPGGQRREMLSFRFLFDDAAGRHLLGGVSVDITEQKAAERALSEALAGKDVLLREVHHRVKNNLQTISSLLNMQAEVLPDLAARQALRDAQRRVHSMALIHEQMYGDKDMDEVDFGEYAKRLTRDLFDSFGAAAARVRLRFALDPVSLAMDQMIPCGLILNELVTNSLKYAFPCERAGEILISLRCADGGTVSMTVADDGAGMAPGSDGKRSGSLGTRIVEILTRQLGGRLDRQSAGGYSSTVTFTRIGKA